MNPSIQQFSQLFRVKERRRTWSIYCALIALLLDGLILLIRLLTGFGLTSFWPVCFVMLSYIGSIALLFFTTRTPVAQQEQILTIGHTGGYNGMSEQASVTAAATPYLSSLDEDEGRRYDPASARTLSVDDLSSNASTWRPISSPTFASAPAIPLTPQLLPAFLNVFKCIHTLVSGVGNLSTLIFDCGENVRTPHGIARVWPWPGKIPLEDIHRAILITVYH